MNRPAAMNEETPSISRSFSSRERMTLLPEGFTPTEDDVICGRGKKCYAHVGNERFKRRVVGMLDEYRKARSKLDKSKVLSDVVEQVRLNSPRGGFVKQDSNGRWYEVGDFLAREKTSQAFRDALHENYKSSNVAKKKRRQQDHSRTEKISKLHPDGDISSRMEKLSFAQHPRHDIGSMGFARMPVELRHDHDRTRSYSFTQSPSPRLATANAPASAKLSIDELKSMPSDVKPFYFSSEMEERGGGEYLPRSRRSTMRTPHYNPQSHSLPCSPANVPSVYEDADMEDLHHSVPNLHFSMGGASRKEPPIREMEAMHHSLPNFYFDHEASDDMEPIPLDLALPPLSERQHRHSAPAALAQGRTADPLNKDEQPITISNTLIESLAKITESASTDDNPFEPIPLSPPTKKRPSVGVTKDDFPNIEEQPLDDAFGEEEED